MEDIQLRNLLLKNTPYPVSKCNFEIIRSKVSFTLIYIYIKERKKQAKFYKKKNIIKRLSIINKKYLSVA